MAMGIERGVAMVVLAKYDNKVELAVNKVFDQLATEAGEAQLKAEAEDMLSQGKDKRKAAIDELKSNYLPDWVLAAMSTTSGDPVESLALIKKRTTDMPKIVMEYKIAVGEMTAAPLTSQNSTDTEQREALRRFEKMLAMGIPQEKVKERMVKAGVDPSLMERIGFLPCLNEQLDEWRSIHSMLQAEADKHLPLFDEGAEEITRLETTMGEIDKSRNSSQSDPNKVLMDDDPSYWRGGEGAAGDLTPAALRRLRARIDQKRMELDGLIESPTPDWEFFVGKRTGSDPSESDY